jgi:hypothetical protein
MEVGEIDDSFLLILLGGIKELARLRGFNKVNYTTNTAHDRVTAVCSIEWKPNFETENQVVEFSAIGDATPQNTHEFAQFYLAPIAENRAFVRCVRNFLNIDIVGKDEIGTAPVVSSEDNVDVSNPKVVLAKLLDKNKIKFESFKNQMIKHGIEAANDWTNVGDISGDVFKCIELVNALLEKKKSKS